MSLLTRINRSYGLQTDSIVSLEVWRVYFCACCMFGDDLTSFECDLEIHLLGGGLIFAPRRMKAPFGNYAERLFRQVRAHRVEDLQRSWLAVLAEPAVQPYCDGFIRLCLRLRLRSTIGESAMKLAAPIVDLRVLGIVEVLRRVIGPDHYSGIDLEEFLIAHPALDVAGERSIIEGEVGRLANSLIASRPTSASITLRSPATSSAGWAMRNSSRSIPE